MLLAHLARAGHRAVALIGAGTGLIGDPSGRSAERPLLAQDEIDANAERISAQLARVFAGTDARGILFRNNAEWLRDARMLDFMRDVGKHFSVNYLLAKDSVQTRLGTGISYTEFSYMLLQALDFLELHKRLGVTLQVGGSDQWGNLTAGVELVRRSAGVEVHAFTAPLITTASGKKFGKTEAGAVWLDPTLTSAYRFYQFWINVDDADVGRYLRMLTLLPKEEIVALEKTHAAVPHERGAQRTLARAMTALLHDPDAARVAEECSQIVFDRKADPTRISDQGFLMLSREIPGVRLARSDQLDVLTVLEGAFGVSRGAGRKLIQQGGVTVNGVKLGAGDLTVSRERAVRGRWLLVRKGARDVAVAEVGG